MLSIAFSFDGDSDSQAHRWLIDVHRDEFTNMASLVAQGAVTNACMIIIAMPDRGVEQLIDNLCHSVAAVEVPANLVSMLPAVPMYPPDTHPGRHELNETSSTDGPTAVHSPFREYYELLTKTGAHQGCTQRMANGTLYCDCGIHAQESQTLSGGRALVCDPDPGFRDPE